MGTQYPVNPEVSVLFRINYRVLAFWHPCYVLYIEYLYHVLDPWVPIDPLIGFCQDFYLQPDLLISKLKTLKFNLT